MENSLPVVQKGIIIIRAIMDTEQRILVGDFANRSK